MPSCHQKLLEGRILSCVRSGGESCPLDLWKREREGVGRFGRRGDNGIYSIESRRIVFESNAFEKKGKPFPVLHAQI